MLVERRHDGAEAPRGLDPPGGRRARPVAGGRHPGRSYASVQRYSSTSDHGPPPTDASFRHVSCSGSETSHTRRMRTGGLPDRLERQAIPVDPSAHDVRVPVVVGDRGPVLAGHRIPAGHPVQLPLQDEGPVRAGTGPAGSHRRSTGRPGCAGASRRRRRSWPACPGPCRPPRWFPSTSRRGGSGPGPPSRLPPRSASGPSVTRAFIASLLSAARLHGRDETEARRGRRTHGRRGERTEATAGCGAQVRKTSRGASARTRRRWPSP